MTAYVHDTPFVRVDGRDPWDLRSVSIERGVNCYAEGSALVRWGNTVVYCTASLEERVPPFLRGAGQGWVTAEYAMLPRATHERGSRNGGGRAGEIQRLIGRSLRAAVDLVSLGERTIWIDCDILQADGGTRTASITGAFVALVDALRALRGDDKQAALPLKAQVAAVSVGKLAGRILLDLCYEEDRAAGVDSNIVMSSSGDFVELQGTAENGLYSRSELGDMLTMAEVGLRRLFMIQKETLRLSAQEEELFNAIAQS